MSGESNLNGSANTNEDWWSWSWLWRGAQTVGYALRLASAALSAMVASWSWTSSAETQQADTNNKTKANQGMDYEVVGSEETGNDTVISEQLAVSDAELQNNLTTLYEGLFPLEKDNKLGRVLSLAATDNSVNAQEEPVTTEQQELSDLRALGLSALMLLNQADEEFQAASRLASAKFILKLLAHPNIHHLDVSAWEFTTTGAQDERVKQFFNQLLDSTVASITRITFHANNAALNDEFATKLNTHRQLYIAEKCAVDCDAKHASSRFCPPALQNTNWQGFLHRHSVPLYHAFKASTDSLLAILEPIVSVNDRKESASFWNIAKLGVERVGAYLQRQFQTITTPAPAAVETLVVFAEKADTKKSAKSFFTNHFVVPANHFFESWHAKKSPSRYVLYDESASKEVRLAQHTTEVMRIVALWGKWQTIENGPRSQSYKERKREEIFTDILYAGLVKAGKKENAGRREKILLNRSNVDQLLNKLGAVAVYGAEEVAKKRALYNQACDILTNGLGEWAKQDQSQFSDIRQIKASMTNLAKGDYAYDSKITSYCEITDSYGLKVDSYGAKVDESAKASRELATEMRGIAEHSLNVCNTIDEQALEAHEMAVKATGILAEATEMRKQAERRLELKKNSSNGSLASQSSGSGGSRLNSTEDAIAPVTCHEKAQSASGVSIDTDMTALPLLPQHDSSQIHFN